MHRWHYMYHFNLFWLCSLLTRSALPNRDHIVSDLSKMIGWEKCHLGKHGIDVIEGITSFFTGIVTYYGYCRTVLFSWPKICILINHKVFQAVIQAKATIWYNPTPYQWFPLFLAQDGNTRSTPWWIHDCSSQPLWYHAAKILMMEFEETFDTLLDAEQSLNEYEMANYIKYSVRKTKGLFNKNGKFSTWFMLLTMVYWFTNFVHSKSWAPKHSKASCNIFRERGVWKVKK